MKPLIIGITIGATGILAVEMGHDVPGLILLLAGIFTLAMIPE